MDTILLIVVTLIVGFLCGCTSVGGVLLIPSLHALSGLDLRTVMGTVLLAFFFSGIGGLLMHIRAGRIDKNTAAPLCLGGLLFGFAGAVAKQYVAVPLLGGILGAAIVIAGTTALRPVRGSGLMASLSPRTQKACLFIIGSGVAFISAMTGAGGPVISVPLMLILGYPPLFCIASAMPLAVALTFSGSVGNVLVGAIDYPIGAMITVLMTVGILAGTWSIKFFNPEKLKIGVSAMCIFTGLYMLATSVLG